MALIPDNTVEFDEPINQEELPSKTWAIDFKNGRIGGFIDGHTALKQFVKKALLTERNKYAVYTDAYGCELSDLVGQSLSDGFLNAEIPRIVEEALIYDDRVNEVSVFHERRGDQLQIEVSVNGTIIEVVKRDGI